MNNKTTDKNTHGILSALAIIADAAGMGTVAFYIIEAINHPHFWNSFAAACCAGLMYAGREWSHAHLLSHTNIHAHTVNINPPDQDKCE